MTPASIPNIVTSSPPPPPSSPPTSNSNQNNNESSGDGGNSKFIIVGGALLAAIGAGYVSDIIEVNFMNNKMFDHFRFSLIIHQKIRHQKKPKRKLNLNHSQHVFHQRQKTFQNMFPIYSSEEAQQVLQHFEPSNQISRVQKFWLFPMNFKCHT